MTTKNTTTWIEKREEEGITILDLKGRLVLGTADLTLHEQLLSLLDKGVRNVILNFKAVSALDTAAVGSLLFCGSKFQDAGGSLVLLNLSPAHAQLAGMFRLTTAFAIHGKERDAVNSFFPERRATRRYDILEFVKQSQLESLLSLA